ncbi:MAG: tetratricopeptide repeat protein [Gloeotrichia echinulata CP02]|jgi:tetratricopeptide (TPR) repeat protein|nr:tetratricopeptide repeat protein [Gloeotrichia echinulata DEX184]
MKRFISTAAATVTLVLSLSTQAMSAPGHTRDSIKASPMTALNKESKLLLLPIPAQNAETYMKQAFLRFQLGDFKGAIEYLNQAIQINPNYATAALPYLAC